MTTVKIKTVLAYSHFFEPVTDLFLRHKCMHVHALLENMETKHEGQDNYNKVTC